MGTYSRELILCSHLVAAGMVHMTIQCNCRTRQRVVTKFSLVWKKALKLPLAYLALEVLCLYFSPLALSKGAADYLDNDVS